jgi:hypothetical protein
MLSFMHDGEARGFETIGTTTSSIGFTSTYYNYSSAGNLPMKAALITCETADVRFTLDGTTPTVTSGTGAGHLLGSGQNYVVRGYENCRNFRCINAVGSSGATLKCTYFY